MDLSFEQLTSIHNYLAQRDSSISINKIQDIAKQNPLLLSKMITESGSGSSDSLLALNNLNNQSESLLNANERNAAIDSLSLIPGVQRDTLADPSVRLSSKPKYSVADLTSRDATLSVLAGSRQVGSGWAESVGDAVVGVGWGLADTATFGLLGLGWSSIDDESYNRFMQDIQDTSAGRIGIGLGGAAGFLLPMGLVGKGLNVATRAAVKGLNKVGWMKKGLTPAGLQKEAAKKILNATKNSLIKKSGGKLTEQQAITMAKETSEDLIGLSMKPGTKWYQRFLGQGNAYIMENGGQMSAHIAKQLNEVVPRRLYMALQKKGITMKPQELLKLSDEMVETLAKKPLASFESVLEHMLGGNTIARVLAGSTQEAINFGITGTMMDYTAKTSGQLEFAEDETYMKKFWHHAAVGFGLGLSKVLIPGGRDAAAWRDVRRRLGWDGAVFAKKVRKMNHKQVGNLASDVMRNDRSFAFIAPNGKAVSMKAIRDGKVGKELTGDLKESIINHMRNQEKAFFNGPWKSDIGKDLLESATRMSVGSAIMNYSSLSTGQFGGLTPEEKVFHLALGAFMTKRGKALKPNSKSRWYGDRPYYYNSELTAQMKELGSMNVDLNHLDVLGKEWMGDAAIDYHNFLGGNQDVRSIEEILIRNNVYYNKMEHKDTHGVELMPGKGDLILDHNLQIMVNPLEGILLSRGLELRPDIKKSDMVKAREEISSLKSEILSVPASKTIGEDGITIETPGKTVMLASRRAIQESLYKGNAEGWLKLNEDIYNTVKQMVGVLTGDPKHLNEDGSMIEINWGNMKDIKLNTEQKITLKKVQNLLENLSERGDGLGQIRMKNIDIDGERGMRVEITNEKLNTLQSLIDAWEGAYGSKIYGKSFELPADIEDPAIWSQLREHQYIRNVEDVHQVIMGKQLPNVDPKLQKKINTLTEEIFGGEGNRNPEAIIDKVSKILFTDPSSETAQVKGDYQDLVQFTNILYSVLQRGKSPTHTNNMNIYRGKVAGGYEVSMDKIRELKESLVKAGMPDISIHGLSTKMQDWVDRIRTHATSESLRGLDADGNELLVIDKMMESGFIYADNTGTGTGTRLKARAKITVDQVLANGWEVSRERAQEIVDAYDRVLNKLNAGSTTERIVIETGPTVRMDQFSPEQWHSLMIADKILDSKTLQSDFNNTMGPIQEIMTTVSEKYNLLSVTKESGMDPKTGGELSDRTLSNIESRMKELEIIMDEISGFHNSFLGAYRGSIEISRAQSFIDKVKDLKDARGETIFDKIEKLSNLEDMSQFNSLAKEFKNLQVEIATQIDNMNTTRTSMDQMRWDEVNRRIEEDRIEGRYDKDNKNNVTADKYLSDNGLTIKNLIDNNIIESKTYQNSNEALLDIYKKTAQVGDLDGFIKKMEDIYRLESTADKRYKTGFRYSKKKGVLPNEVRDNILALHKNYKRAFKARRISLNLDQRGQGSFENIQISQGFLTDLYKEVFLLDPLTFISNSVFYGGRKRTVLNEDWLRTEMDAAINSSDLVISKADAFSEYQRFLRAGRSDSVEKGTSGEYRERLNITEDIMQGEHYIVGVDENINIVVGKHQFEPLTNAFVKWYETSENGPNSKLSKRRAREIPGAKDILKSLKDYYERILELKKQRKPIDVEEFIGLASSGVSLKNQNSEITNAIHKMFNVMYASKTHGDWLKENYISQDHVRSTFKYKRLTQNRGYVRDNREQRLLFQKVYEDNPRFKKLADKYLDKDVKHFVIDDTMNSKAGEDANGLITDNRSQVERSLKKALDRGEIDDIQHAYNLEILRNNNSINAEGPNGATFVSRDRLDYMLAKDGQSGVIGSSSGLKPVGLSSFTDSQGRVNVFYNKTHYFYDAKLDPWFKKNPEYDMIAFRSGVKRFEKINPETGKNEAEGYKDIPRVGEVNPVTGKEWTMDTWINSINPKEHSKSVFDAHPDQMVTGTIYGSPHEAKIIKQFPNWGSAEMQELTYRWARQDALERFGNQTIELYDATRTDLAVSEAQRSLIDPHNKEGYLNSDMDNPGFSTIWIESGGIPFSGPVKSAYDQIVMKRYVHDAGGFDGYTSLGGTAIVRPDLKGDLSIPIYAEVNGKRTQVMLGEANVGWDYMDRRIVFNGDYKVMPRHKDKTLIERRSYKDTGTLTVSFRVGSKETGDVRDIAIDLKGDMHLTHIVDPLGKITAWNQMPVNIKSSVKMLKDKIVNQEILKVIDLHKTLRNGTDMGDVKGWVTTAVTPAPRVGPHDLIVARIKGWTEAKDGGLIELNNFDITSKAQRDYDTDKMPFYMDTPFEILKEAWMSSGDILEPVPMMPEMRTGKDLDMFNHNSFMDYQAEVNAYKRARGDVIKMQRKLTYAQIVFGKMKDGGIVLGDGSKIVFNANSTAKQRSTSDGQNILDIYKDFPTYLSNMKDHADATLFGDSSKPGANVKRDAITDQPYFHIEYKGEKNPSTITSEAHKFIVHKVLSDYGRLLQLENNIWDSGEGKAPRYQDYVERSKDFYQNYREDRVNWNFINYLKKKGISEEVVNQMFFKDGDPKKGMKPILNDLAANVRMKSTAFEKTLDKLVFRDHLEVRTQKSPRKQGDYFNAGVDKLLGEKRQEVLNTLQITGEYDPVKAIEAKQPIAKTLWEAFNEIKGTEEKMVQLNHIESQIRRKEFVLSKDKNGNSLDKESMELELENLQILNEAKRILTNKLTLDKDIGGQTLRHYSESKSNDIYVTRRGEIIVIRDSKSGEKIRTLNHGDTYTLKRGEVSVKNPVILKPVVEASGIDGIAHAHTVLGVFHNIRENDLPAFRKISLDAKSTIKKAMSETMKEEGFRDWQKYQHKVDSAIARALNKLVAHINENNINPNLETVETFFGTLPKAHKDYPLHLMMSMLVPNYSTNKNEFHYLPKTGGFVPSVGIPSTSVINAVFKTIEAYQMVPDYRAFVSDYAKTHKNFWDAAVAGEGFDKAIRQLSESSFETSLLTQNIEKSLNNPFLSKKDYKDMREWNEYNSGVNSEFAELYRQIVVEGSSTDPATMFRLREKIITEYGQEAYRELISVSRGSVWHDGTISKAFTGYGGLGKKLGEIFDVHPESGRRRLSVRIPSKPNQDFREYFNDRSYQSNFKKKTSDGC